MTAAIFGLLGVLVGALVTGFVNYVLERRRELVEARAAARLMRSEVVAAGEAVATTLEEGEWPISYRPTWRESWIAYRRALAGRLPGEDFEAVARAYARMDQLQGGFETGRPPDERALSDVDRKHMKQDVEPTLGPAQARLDTFLAE
jgi:hypothetical protein